MTPPPVQLFLTTIASQPALRQRQEYILRSLQVKKIPFTSYDLASDEDAKRLWKRKAPLDKQQLPGILVGGKFPGTFSQFEEAVEFNELEIFLRQNEEWKPHEDEKRTMLEVKPVGVPGAYEPLQMFPKHAPSRSPSPDPRSLREKEKKELDVSNQLGEFGLEGVSVSADDLRALVEELGLGGDEAADLVKGLAGDGPTEKTKESKQEINASKPDEKAVEKVVEKAEVKVEVRAEEKAEVKAEEKAEQKAEEKAESVKSALEIKVEPENAVDKKVQNDREKEPQAQDAKAVAAEAKEESITENKEKSSN